MFVLGLVLTKLEILAQYKLNKLPNVSDCNTDLFSFNFHYYKIKKNIILLVLLKINKV